MKRLEVKNDSVICSEFLKPKWVAVDYCELHCSYFGSFEEPYEELCCNIPPDKEATLSS